VFGFILRSGLNFADATQPIHQFSLRQTWAIGSQNAVSVLFWTKGTTTFGRPSLETMPHGSTHHCETCVRSMSGAKTKLVSNRHFRSSRPLAIAINCSPYSFLDRTFAMFIRSAAVIQPC